jgi:hypothetical protein
MPSSTRPRWLTGSAPTIHRAFIASVVCASSVAGCSRVMSNGNPAAVSAGGDVAPMVSGIVASWPAKPRDAASKLVAKYGQPSVTGDRMLVWYNKGPYSRIALSRDEQPHDFPAPHTDFLAETVRYRVPADRLDDLGRYDGSVWFQRTRGELTAQCDMEELDNLALNLANDIVTRRRTVEDARAFYAMTAMAFKQGDRSSPYLTGLLFTPQPNSADPDHPAK